MRCRSSTCSSSASFARLHSVCRNSVSRSERPAQLKFIIVRVARKMIALRHYLQRISVMTSALDCIYRNSIFSILFSASPERIALLLSVHSTFYLRLILSLFARVLLSPLNDVQKALRLAFSFLRYSVRPLCASMEELCSQMSSANISKRTLIDYSSLSLSTSVSSLVFSFEFRTTSAALQTR